MTEAEWLRSDDPFVLSRHSAVDNGWTERKYTLFAAACLRRFWKAERDGPFGRAGISLDDVDLLADGRRSPFDAIGGSERWGGSMGTTGRKDGFSVSISNIAPDEEAEDIFRVVCDSRFAAEVMRDLTGNPFRPVQLDPAWLAWNDGAVRKISQMIYDERRFSDLPVLADALEDSGCVNADILAHCRSGTEHVRGCFTLDLLLGKT